MRPEKQTVKHFYESFGWKRAESGAYQDTAAFVDGRAVMEPYHERAMARLSRYFKGGGPLFLDAGCGALASRAYVEVGAPYSQRVCVDLSTAALNEARTKLGEDTWFIVADISALPFRDGVFNGVLCAHVLYHVPADEQVPTLSELYRVLCNGGIGIVVYTWASCFMTQMARVLNPRVLLPGIPGMRWLWRRFFKPRASQMRDNVHSPSHGIPPLYFHPHNYAWFRAHVRYQIPASLACWESVSLPFSQAFIFNNRIGALVLRVISLLETLFPKLIGRLGAYPLFILRK